MAPGGSSCGWGSSWPVKGAGRGWPTCDPASPPEGGMVAVGGITRGGGAGGATGVGRNFS